MSTADKIILVMLSGGLDSTYLLYKYLTETDLPVHVHHISLQVEKENRWAVEDTCAANIIDFCSQFREFSYSASVYKFGLPYTGWDTDLELLIAARVAANLDANQVVVTLGINADDLVREDIIERNERKVLDNLWTAMLASIDEPRRKKIHPRIHLPFKNTRKAQMLRELPLDLLEMTWSCRKPVFEEKEGKKVALPCNQCHACIARITAAQEAYEMPCSECGEPEIFDDTIRL